MSSERERALPPKKSEPTTTEEERRSFVYVLIHLFYFVFVTCGARPGPLSSSNVVTPPFIPSEAPPWDSRPVSGAGVVHYHSLHRPRSVPTALGPAPLVTVLLNTLFLARHP